MHIRPQKTFLEFFSLDLGAPLYKINANSLFSSPPAIEITQFKETKLPLIAWKFKICALKHFNIWQSIRIKSTFYSHWQIYLNHVVSRKQPDLNRETSSIINVQVYFAPKTVNGFDIFKQPRGAAVDNSTAANVWVLNWKHVSNFFQETK